MENKEKPSATSREEKKEITEMVKDFEQVLEGQNTTVLALEYDLVHTIGERIQERLARIKQQTSEETSNTHESVDGTAEKAVGALCYLPKSIHRLATRYADDHDVTAKRFFFETMLIGLEQQGIITHEQHLQALTLPNEYGWKGRGNNSTTQKLKTKKL